MVKRRIKKKREKKRKNQIFKFLKKPVFQIPIRIAFSLENLRVGWKKCENEKNEKMTFLSHFFQPYTGCW